MTPRFLTLTICYTHLSMYDGDQLDWGEIVFKHTIDLEIPAKHDGARAATLLSSFEF